MAQKHSESLLLKIKPLLESEGPFLNLRNRERPAVEPGASFSALDLRDRVVIMLLFDQIVSVEQVEAAWRRWQDDEKDTPDALWRVVARQPGVDAEAVFNTAARVYAFEPAHSMLHHSLALMLKHRGRFSLRQRRRLASLGVLPVRIDSTDQGARWIFATHDPARPAVQRLLSSLDVPAYEVCYAPAEAVREQIAEALPGAITIEETQSGGAATEAAASNSRPAPRAATLPVDEADSSGASAAALQGSKLSFLDDLFGEDSGGENFGGEDLDDDSDSGDARDEVAGRQERRVLRGNETVRTFASIYEELLAGAARSGASRVRLTVLLPDANSHESVGRRQQKPSAGEQFTAAFEYDDRDERREVALRVPPGAVLSFMRRRTRSARHGTASKKEGKRVHRWIENRRRSFLIHALPNSKAWAAGRADILIEAEK